MNILVTGSLGQLGNEIKYLVDQDLFPNDHFHFYDYLDLDITDSEKVNGFFDSNEIHCVINCAAYTQVDKAEEDRVKAGQVNVDGVKHLAQNCKKHNAFMVHVSTDYVFDGTKETAYIETDLTGPIGVYGQTKLDGELALREILDRSATIRTSWVYARYGHNFLKTMMRLGKTKDSLNVVSDQIGCPTYAGDIAKAIFKVLERKDEIQENELLHFTNTGRVSWFDFAAFIMKESGSNCKVNPIPSSEYPTPAKRPNFSLLDTTKIQEKYNVVCPDWKESASLVIKHYLIENQMNEMLEKIDINEIIAISKDAGKAILEVYGEEFTVDVKEDKSPLTAADKNANAVIEAGLLKSYPNIPILSEETKAEEFSIRKDWDFFWLVDPLDGTKEFIKRNGEFTVNIALIHKGRPVLGVIYVPVTEKVFYATKGKGSFCIENGETRKLQKAGITDGKISIAASRSHLNEDTQAFVEEKKKDYEVNFISAGSSLKFCLVAEGKAHFYPRFAPTMEWDTGAGQIIAEESGATVTQHGSNKALEYNKENLLNPYFLVS